MEQDRAQRYVKTLEKTIDNNSHYLKKTIEDFQELCRMVTPDKNVPSGIPNDIREMYKEIRSRLTEVKAVEQLLHGKYRQYYHRNSQRDKELLEIGFIAKNGYSKFEYILKQIEARKKLREKTEKPEAHKEYFLWFRSEENQVALIKNLRMLIDLDYETSPDMIGQDRRDLLGNRELTLFLIHGKAPALDLLQSHIRLREHDVLERYNEEEIRGILVHLKRIVPSDVEKIFRNFLCTEGLTNLKCLCLPIYSPKDLEDDIPHRMLSYLEKMVEGELKTLSM